MKWNTQKIVSKLTRRFEVIPLGARQLEPAKIQQHCPSSIVFIFNLNLLSTLNSLPLKLYLFLHSQSQSEFPHIFRKSFLSIWAEEIRNQKKRRQCNDLFPWFFVFMLQNCEQWSPPQDSWEDKSGEIILERRLSLINHQLIFTSTVTVHENFFWSVLSSAKSSFCGRRKGNSWFPRMRSKRNYSYENHNCDHNLHQPDWSAARI